MKRLCSDSVKSNMVTGLEYLLMGLVVGYTSMWSQFADIKSNLFLRLAYPVLVLLIALRVRRLTGDRLRRLLLLAGVLAVYLLGSRYNPIRYGLYLVGPLLLLTLYWGEKQRDGKPFDLLYKLGDLVVVLAAISLFCFVFGTTLNILPGQTVSYFFANRLQSCTTYFHLYYAAQTMPMFGQVFVRNCGVFPEAPGFAMFLTVALSTEVFLRDKPRPWRCGILVAAALTTFSTKAILLSLLVFALKLVITTPKSLRLRQVKRVAVPLTAAVCGVAAAVLLLDKMNTSSFYIRADDLLASWKTFLSAPAFGAGYYNDEAIIARFAYPRNNNGLSMGLAVLLAQGGVYLTAVYLVPMGLCIRRFAARRRAMAAFFLVYIGLLFVSNMPFSFLAILLLAFSLEAGQTPVSEPSF